MTKLLRFFFVIAVMHSIALAPASADIIGSQGFDLTFTPSSGSLDQAFSLTGVDSSSAQLGDFIGLPIGTDWGSFSVGAFSIMGTPLSITNADFGSFTGTITGDSGEFSPGGSAFFRVISATGEYVPGSNPFFAGDTALTGADLSITFTKANSGAAITGALSLATSTIPEPSSIALLGLATLCGGIAYRRRVKTSTS